MKILKIIIIALLFFFLVNSTYSQTQYGYYYKGEKRYFTLNTEYAFLSLGEPQLPEYIIQHNVNFSELQSDKSCKKKYHEKKGTCRFWTELHFEEPLSEKQYLELLSDIKSQNKDIIISPCLQSKNKEKIGLSNFFYVKLKEEKDTLLLRQTVESTNTVIIEQDAFMPLWFVVSTTSLSDYNAIELANIFYESGLFQCAIPDLMVGGTLTCVNDTYFTDQWGLRNTGQYGGISGIDIKACESWQISTGSNIIVAVFDEGVELDHPDLAANIYPLSYDSENDITPSTIYGPHGVACAGIIGAVKNEEGIAGVAPNAKIMSISSQLMSMYPPSILIMQKRAKGINWAWQNGADIICNSWGSNYLEGEYITDAIDNAVIQGRGGLGCVVVFATGNTNQNMITYPASLPTVIAVGAISPCGERKSPSSCDSTFHWGSHYGNELDIVAPGVFIPTTDLQGLVGYNPDSGIPDNYTDLDYTRWFSGTSAACPHVSGVAALILSVNPNLTGQQVHDIIESTAQKVRPDLYDYNYDNIDIHPNGTWNEEMGHGLVDAYAAVLKTVCYKNSSNAPEIISGNQVWGTPRFVHDTIVITYNSTLTISAEMKCAPHVKIIIEPRGKLIIDGGTLTNVCPDQMWQGITVIGDPTVFNAAAQSKVEVINGGRIENAVCAIHSVDGGSILTSNAFFENNLTAIQIDPLAPSQIQTSINKCERTNFYFNDNFFGNPLHFENIKIFPNPTTGELTIDNAQLTIRSVEIFDVYGRKVLEPPLTVLQSYDLTVLQPGIYFIKITTETGIITKKVIKINH